MRIKARKLDGACNLIAGLGMVIGLLMLVAPPAAAAQDSGWTQVPASPPTTQSNPAQHAKKSKERIVSVTLAKGQTYTIHGVANGAPAVKVVNNRNAMVVQHAPGRIVLVGAATGSWKLNVTMASGEKVIYEVNVKAAGTEQGSLVPGAAPTVMP